MQFSAQISRMDAPIKTPCVKVCFVDPAQDICIGCFRSLEELGRWSKYSDAEREAIMAALPDREAAYRDRKRAMS